MKFTADWGGGRAGRQPRLRRADPLSREAAAPGGQARPQAREAPRPRPRGVGRPRLGPVLLALGWPPEAPSLSLSRDFAAGLPLCGPRVNPISRGEAPVTLGLPRPRGLAPTTPGSPAAPAARRGRPHVGRAPGRRAPRARPFRGRERVAARAAARNGVAERSAPPGAARRGLGARGGRGARGSGRRSRPPRCAVSGGRRGAEPAGADRAAAAAGRGAPPRRGWEPRPPDPPRRRRLPLGELGSPRATLGSAWQPPGAAATVLGLQVLPGTKLDCDLLPERWRHLLSRPCPGAEGLRPEPGLGTGCLSNEPLVLL
ncbi:hypothetical protein VULLAG_LOCUS13087 [Vulpes lagopus]